ncbi:BTB/POZ domain-containing protein 6-B-like [Paramacrobiotus metropolitanus]|uniref:BTB/POZ domain-containing protein 6-B-like n=1 Tax=Paramacrobiotus metropolitanus TaxID=2943436 RepID=UPI00244645C6|nr:BTB/POZ domain-containing protein 6-B-like [Paramacrobiotus metropolitanus]
MEDLTLDNVYQTLYCGKRYDIPQLVEACCTFLAGQLNGTNWLTHFEKAKLWDAEKATQTCLEFVDRSTELALQSEHFENMEHETLMMILRRDTLTTDENTIYLAVERWAAAACARADMEPTPENRRQTLGAALNLIRFPMLRIAQLLDGPAKTGMLQQAELRDIYQYKHATVKPSLPFPTEPRQGAVHRVGAFTFKDQEEIFVKSGELWYAALVTGVSAPNITFIYAYAQNESVVAPDKIIRAVDILKRGQRLCYHYGGCCRYLAEYVGLRRPGVHSVRYCWKEHGKRFANLCLDSEDLKAWKKAKLAAT